MKAAAQIENPRNNLPTPLSSFIGRDHEIMAVRQLLASQRLVTLTGPGGSGKTRLALRVAEELSGEFEHGIWLVELASIFDSAIVLQTIASIFDFREQTGQQMLDTLVRHLAGRQALLVLDNCEHLLDACAGFHSVPGRVRPEEVVQVADCIEVKIWAPHQKRGDLAAFMQADRPHVTTYNG